MPKYDDAEIQDVKYDAAIHRGNVEWAQRGLPHRHILPYHVIQELELVRGRGGASLFGVSFALTSTAAGTPTSGTVIPR